jgi:hypothetical protein
MEASVGTDIADDGVPAEFRSCPLFRVATIEPLGPSATIPPVTP